MSALSQFLSSLLLLALLLVPAAHAADSQKTSSNSQKTSSNSQKSSSSSSDAIDSIGKMIPEGKKNLKVRIPGFDNGRPSSMIVAATMTRINPQELYSEIMRIDLYAKEAKENVRVDLKTGTYHMDSKMLSSQERSKVTRSDFVIEGDSMQFDTVSSQGKMIGNVRMVIFDTSSFSAPKPDQPKSKDPADASPAAPGAPTAAAAAPEPTPPGK